MTVIIKNNVSSTLASAISATQTTVSVAAATGDQFPDLPNGSHFYATFMSSAGDTEIVKCVARVGDALAVVRGSEETAPRAFAAGSRVELRVTAQAIIDAIVSRVAGSVIDTQTFDSSGTWTKPAGYSASSRVLVQAWGAGGSGGRNTTATSASGGGGGGYIERWLNLSQLGATETITIGAGGAARTDSNQNGAAGGNTTVGSLVTAYGGGGGCGTVSLGSGGGGGGQLSAGTTGTTSSPVDPGRPFFTIFNDDGAAGNLRQGSGLSAGGESTATVLSALLHGGGGGCASVNLNGAGSVYGGGGGGGNTTGAGGTSLFGGNGGAAGANGTAGTQPGGGGGAATGTSGAGAAGRAIITVFPA